MQLYQVTVRHLSTEVLIGQSIIRGKSSTLAHVTEYLNQLSKRIGDGAHPESFEVYVEVVEFNENDRLAPTKLVPHRDILDGLRGMRGAAFELFGEEHPLFIEIRDATALMELIGRSSAEKALVDA